MAQGNHRRRDKDRLVSALENEAQSRIVRHVASAAQRDRVQRASAPLKLMSSVRQVADVRAAPCRGSGSAKVRSIHADL